MFETSLLLLELMSIVINFKVKNFKFSSVHYTFILSGIWIKDIFSYLHSLLLNYTSFWLTHKHQFSGYYFFLLVDYYLKNNPFRYYQCGACFYTKQYILKDILDKIYMMYHKLLSLNINHRLGAAISEKLVWRDCNFGLTIQREEMENSSF